MKKFGLCLLLCLCLCLSFSVLASAEDTLDYVTDAAGILTQEQAASLNATAAQIAEQYSCAVYLVTLPDYRSYNSEGIEQCTQELYHYFDLGYGENRDGLILLLSMAERDYDLWGYGPFGVYAFTDFGLDGLEESFLPYFRQNDWYGGFSAYLRGAASLLDQAAQGQPAEYHMPKMPKAAIALGSASLIGDLPVAKDLYWSWFARIAQPIAAAIGAFFYFYM